MPKALASLERETIIPLLPPEVITQTGLSCKDGLSTLSQDTKNESQSISAIIRCFIFILWFLICSMVTKRVKMSIRLSVEVGLKKLDKNKKSVMVYFIK